VAGAGVHYCPRIDVIAHEFRIDVLELADEIIRLRQGFIRCVKLVAQLARGNLGGGARIARFADEQVVSGDDPAQRGQLGLGHSILGQIGEIGFGRVVDALAALGRFHVAPTHQIAHGQFGLCRQLVVLGFRGVGMNGGGDRLSNAAHGLAPCLFILGNAASVLRLALRKGLDVDDTHLEVAIGGHKCRQPLPNSLIGVANSLDGQIHAKFIKLFIIQS